MTTSSKESVSEWSMAALSSSGTRTKSRPSFGNILEKISWAFTHHLWSSPMPLKICRQCRHYQSINLCNHPELLDNVTGEPNDCYMSRTFVEDPILPHCGPAGQYWEAPTASPEVLP